MRLRIGYVLVLAVLAGAHLLTGCSDTSNPMGPNDDDPPAEFNSKAAPGESAEAFIDDDRFSTLKVEVDYMEGYQPTGAALDSLKASLEKHLSKSTIEIRSPTSVPAAGQSTYSAEEIRDLEADHRDQFTSAESSTIWAYALVVDGKFADENVVGLAYYNTSLAFFGQTIDEISGGATQPSQAKVEGSVFRHEFGHILGLVNNGTTMQQDHHDEANGHHCTNDQCVMYYAIETSDYFSNIFDGTIPRFEEFCTEDMAALRGN